MVLNNDSDLPLIFFRSKATLLIFHRKHTEPFSAPAPSATIRKVLAHGVGADCAMASCGGHKLLSSFQEWQGQFRPWDVQGNPRSHCSQESWDLPEFFYGLVWVLQLFVFSDCIESGMRMRSALLPGS